jgi:XrtJ-associated TM-motif-TM protein
MKKVWFLLPIAAFCLLVSAAHAQDGGDGSGPCTDSPENPTAVLAVVGSLGAGAAALRVRLAARKTKK